MRRNPTWILALVVIAAMAAGGWYVLRPRETLTIVSLLQRKYENKPTAAFIDDGILLAMEEVGHRAGRYRLVVENREVQAGMNMSGSLDQEARRAAETVGVVAIIGPSCYQSSQIASEVNRAGLLMVAPDERMPELTKPGFGYSKYTPETYRPSGELNFFRVLPADDVLQRGGAEWAAKRGARSLVMFGEGENVVASNVLFRYAIRLGLTRSGDGKESIFDALLEDDPDVVYLSDSRTYGSSSLLDEARCLGWNGTALAIEDPYWTAPEGTIVVSRARPPAEFVKKFVVRFGRPPEPAAWYGYLAGKTVIDSIYLANSKDRNEIRRACARLPGFDANGDTLSTGLEVSTVQEGCLVRMAAFTPAPPPPVPPKLRLTVSFHGTLKCHRWEGYGSLSRRGGAKGTFYVNPALVGTGDDFLRQEEVQFLQEAGHEVIVGVPPVGAVGPGLTLKELEAIVDRAAADRKPVQFVFQRIGAGDPWPDLISSEDFWALCDYIDAKGFMVVPARDLTR